MKFSVDFETANNNELNKEETWVWLASAYDIEKEVNVGVWHSIDDFFFNFVLEHPFSTFYFHNLTFDGNFLVQYLINRGYKVNLDTKKWYPHTFRVVIDFTNNYYSIEFCTTYSRTRQKRKTFKFLDSLKIIPLKEEDLAKRFGLDTLKGSIDYTKYRPKGYKATKEEIEYIKNDVYINGKALKYFIDNDMLTGMTIGQIAFKEYKKLYPKWRKVYPVLDMEVESFIRKAYHGGWCYANPLYTNQVLNDGLVYDANSLYPSQMELKPLPYGKPFYFKGKPNLKDVSSKFKSYIVHLSCEFEIKKGYLPTIQIKHNISFNPTEYLSYSTEPVELYLTKEEWELVQKHYNLFNINYIDGYYFRMKTGMFNLYINRFKKMKIENDDNKALREIAKLLLNNLYGKFSTNPHRISKIPVIVDGNLTYESIGTQELEPIYIAVGVWITSYGKIETITNAQNNYSRFLYADTDSVHLLGKEIPTNFKVHQTDFGCWKLESSFRKAKYLRAKTYLEDTLQKDGTYKTIVKCAGLPSTIRDNIKIEDFYIGAIFTGKLARKSVKGGVILQETTFEIKG